MLLRATSLLASLVLLWTAGEVHAESPSAAIADLNLSRPAGGGLLDTIRRDLSVAGYTLNEKAELLRGLQGEVFVGAEIEQATKLLEAAQSAYENFELDDALDSLQSMDSILLDAASEEDERELLAERFLLAGLIRFAQKLEDKATNNFRLAHRLKPSRKSLDIKSHRPSVVSMYGGAVRLNKNARASNLTRSWQPENATLYLDGKRVGNTAELPRGPHVLTLKAEGYASQSTALSLDESTDHKIELKRLSLTKNLRRLREIAATDKASSARRFEELAALVGVDALVLVQGTADEPRGAIYNRADKSLSEWVPIGGVRWESLLSRGEEKAATIAVAANGREQESGPWFKQWWGGGLIVGGTAIVGTAIYFALSSSDSTNMEATIDQWCFGNCN
jgi:hypothetical protein